MSGTESPRKFVRDWVGRNVHYYAFDDIEEQGERLADELIAAAKAAGFGEDELEEAIGDDLVDYVIEALRNVHDPEVGHRDSND
jgi:hypothetical protein